RERTANRGVPEPADAGLLREETAGHSFSRDWYPPRGDAEVLEPRRVLPRQHSSVRRNRRHLAPLDPRNARIPEALQLVTRWRVHPPLLQRLRRMRQCCRRASTE